MNMFSYKWYTAKTSMCTFHRQSQLYCTQIRYKIQILLLVIAGGYCGYEILAILLYVDTEVVTKEILQRVIFATLLGVFVFVFAKNTSNLGIRVGIKKAQMNQNFTIPTMNFSSLPKENSSLSIDQNPTQSLSQLNSTMDTPTIHELSNHVQK